MNAPRSMKERQTTKQENHMTTKRTTNSTLVNTQSVEIAMVTVEMAVEILERNTHNRRIRQWKVDQMAEDIANGRWRSGAGGTIVIAEDGTLLDGQHRLWGIVQAGMGIPLIIVRNAPMNAQDMIDTGARRTLADVLRLRGLTASMQLAAGLMVVYKWENGLLRSSHPSQLPSRAQLLGHLEDNRDQWAAVDRIMSSYLNNLSALPLRLMPSVSTAFAYAAQSLNVADDEWDGFVHGLRHGEGLEQGNPILALRSKLMNDAAARDSGQVRAARSYQVQQLAYMIKAWNGWQRGSDMQLIAWRSGGQKPEPFPVMIADGDALKTFEPGRGVVVARSRGSKNQEVN